MATKARSKVGPDTPLTERQREIFEFLVAFLREHHRTPSYREVMRRFGFASTNAVACHCRALALREMIRLKGRTIKILHWGGCCPFCGCPTTSKGRT